MINIAVWIIFGALVGWIASIIMHTNAEQGAVANILIGIVGAFIGGMISRMLGGSGITGFNFSSAILSIIGAVVLIGLLRILRRGHRAV